MAINPEPLSMPPVIDPVDGASQEVSVPASAEFDLLEAVVLLRAVSPRLDRVNDRGCDLPAARELFDASQAVHRALGALAQTMPRSASVASTQAKPHHGKTTSQRRRDRRPSTVERTSPAAAPSPRRPRREPLTVGRRSDTTTAPLLRTDRAAPGSPFDDQDPSCGFVVDWQPVGGRGTER